MHLFHISLTVLELQYLEFAYSAPWYSGACPSPYISFMSSLSSLTIHLIFTCRLNNHFEIFFNKINVKIYLISLMARKLHTQFLQKCPGFFFAIIHQMSNKRRGAIQF